MPVDRIPMLAPGYVNAARRDPDGGAVRLALNRKVTVNTMAAGEKLFVDLLPEGWSGLPPGLPQEVVEDLARRAREAEKKARAQQKCRAQRTLPPVRVRVGTQPTFTRYTFGLPALIAVSSERNDDNKMTMTFEAPLRFDLADVQAALPPMIAAVEAKPASESALLTFEFIGKVDVRTFREDNNYIVDVQPIKPRTEAEGEKLFDIGAIATPPEKRPAPAPAALEKAPGAEPTTAPPAAPAAKPAEAVKPAEIPEKPPVAATIESEAVAAGRAQSRRRSPPATFRRARQPGARARTPASDAAAPVVVEARRQGDAAAADLSVRAADAGRDVPPRRHDLAGVRQRGADRHDQDRGAIGPWHPQRDRHPFGRRPGGPAQARAAETDQRRRRRRRPGRCSSAT